MTNQTALSHKKAFIVARWFKDKKEYHLRTWHMTLLNSRLDKKQNNIYHFSIRLLFHLFMLALESKYNTKQLGGSPMQSSYA